MTVDELLKNYLRTPRFSCNICKPVPGSLQLYETEKGLLIGEKQDRDHLKNPFNDTQYSENIDILYHFLEVAEAAFRGINIRKGIKNAGIRIQPEHLMEVCYIFGLPILDIHPAEEGCFYWGFYVDDFIQQLTDMYVCYALWKALYVGDDSLQKKILYNRKKIPS